MSGKYFSGQAAAVMFRQASAGCRDLWAGCRDFGAGCRAPFDPTWALVKRGSFWPGADTIKHAPSSCLVRSCASLRIVYAYSFSRPKAYHNS